MAFDGDNFTSLGGNSRSGVAPVAWSYQTASDVLAEVAAADYFNAVNKWVRQDDLIYVVAADCKRIYTVQSVDRVNRIVVLDVDAFIPGVMDYFTEVSEGNITGQATVNKFGRNPDVDTGTDPEDIWDAGGIWVPPTQARTHDIASTDAADDGDPVGTGMRTVRISGLTAWDSDEVSEDITLNGTTSVPTANAYVIIHRMKGLTYGSGGTNAGTITATAQTDGTVTAQITIGKGQTLMAIYGIPSTQHFQMVQYYIDMNRTGGAGSSADMDLYLMENAGNADAGFNNKHHLGVVSTGNSHIGHEFKPPFRINGPAIIKIQVENVSANDTDISAGFDGVLIDNVIP